MSPRPDRPQILIPFDRDEALTVHQAADIAGRSVVSIRGWASLHDIGRRVAGRWMISRVALAMHLDNDRKALSAYLAGDRDSEPVVSYFRRLGLLAKKV
jgi:hypothetical protein